MPPPGALPAVNAWSWSGLLTVCDEVTRDGGRWSLSSTDVPTTGALACASRSSPPHGSRTDVRATFRSPGLAAAHRERRLRLAAGVAAIAGRRVARGRRDHRCDRPDTARQRGSVRRLRTRGRRPRRPVDRALDPSDRIRPALVARRRAARGAHARHAAHRWRRRPVTRGAAGLARSAHGTRIADFRRGAARAHVYAAGDR